MTNIALVVLISIAPLFLIIHVEALRMRARCDVTIHKHPKSLFYVNPVYSVHEHWILGNDHNSALQEQPSLTNLSQATVPSATRHKTNYVKQMWEAKTNLPKPDFTGFIDEQSGMIYVLQFRVQPGTYPKSVKAKDSLGYVGSVAVMSHPTPPQPPKIGPDGKPLPPTLPPPQPYEVRVYPRYPLDAGWRAEVDLYYEVTVGKKEGQEWKLLSPPYNSLVMEHVSLNGEVGKASIPGKELWKLRTNVNGWMGLVGGLALALMLVHKCVA